jgi:hypothetical protein
VRLPGSSWRAAATALVAGGAPGGCQPRSLVPDAAGGAGTGGVATGSGGGGGTEADPPIAALPWNPRDVRGIQIQSVSLGVITDVWLDDLYLVE